jgi:hypothetical protein
MYNERSRGLVTKAQGLKVRLDEMDSKMLVGSVGVMSSLKESGRGIKWDLEVYLCESKKVDSYDLRNCVVIKLCCLGRDRARL